MRLASSIINALLALDPDFSGRLEAFDGKVIAIDIRGTGITLCLLAESGKFHLLQPADCEPDTTIAGSPAALFRMGLQQDVSDLVFKGDVEITGDTRLGRKFGKVLKEIEPDLEEPLSRLVGDAAAHRAMNTVSSLAQWARRARDNFTADVSEYLQEESRDVLSAAELEHFMQQVDALRNDTERLDARLHRLLRGRDRT